MWQTQISCFKRLWEMRISDRKKKQNTADTIYPKQGDPEESQWSNQAAKMGLWWNSPIPVISSRKVLSTINLHSRQFNYVSHRRRPRVWTKLKSASDRCICLCVCHFMEVAWRVLSKTITPNHITAGAFGLHQHKYLTVSCYMLC